MRLDKFLAEASVGSRKIIRNFVKDGMITVNNKKITDPAVEIEESMDVIRYLGKRITHPGKMYYMFHKPQGCITATKDLDNKTVLDYFAEDCRKGLFPIGRLDKDTEGLLLLTNDGEFSHKLMYPDKHVEKTYFFWAFGTLSREAKGSLKTGIDIGEGEHLAKAVKLEIEEEGLYLELQDKMKLTNIKGIRINPFHQPVVSGFITITEGRKHQVKRMLKAAGCYIVYLKRTSIGGLTLDDTLKKGHYRELTKEEYWKLTH